MRQEVRRNNPTTDVNINESKVKGLLNSANLYLKPTQHQEYLDRKSEFKVVDGIKTIMDGRPGLLVRGKQLKREAFEGKLKQVLGPFVANCQEKCQEGNHENQCFDMEYDMILIYPGENQLHVRLGEIKRAKNESSNSIKRLLKEAKRQLRKDEKLLNWLLNDIPSEIVDIKSFIILDISEKRKYEELFWDFNDMVLTVKDFENDHEKLFEKLSINLPTSSDKKNEIPKYFLSACSRIQTLIGEKFDTRILKQSSEWMIKYQDNIEQSLIIFNQQQKKIVEKLEKYSNVKNFCFSGGSGTGKTLMAIKCCNKLLERYKNIEVQVYLTTMTQWLSSKHEEGPPVTEPVIKMIQDNINTEKRENVSIQLGTLKQICAQMKIDVPKDDDEYIRDICSIINTLAEKLKNKHQNIPTILLGKLS